MMVAVQFIIPLILRQPFPSTGIFFWGAIQIVMFKTMPHINLPGNEARIILKGLRYSRTRPVVYSDSHLEATGMNDPARQLLQADGSGDEVVTLSDFVRNKETLRKLEEKLQPDSPTSMTITLSDGLTSITLQGEMDNPSGNAAADLMKEDHQPRPVSRDEKVASAAREYDLSSREQDVLSLLLQAHGTGEIANQLFVSNSAAKTRLSNIHRKEGTSDRPALPTRVM